MNRRQWIAQVTALTALFGWARRASAQASVYVRAVEASFDRFAGVTASRGRIAPEGEPGTPLAIAGTLVDADGTTPVAGALVFAYHTDRTGLYADSSSAPHTWRLQGAVRTDRDGRFEFRTIRPQPYPGRTIPAHIHVEFNTASGRFHGGELRFADDPLVGDEERQQSARAGRFAWVKPVRTLSGEQLLDVTMRLSPDQRF